MDMMAVCDPINNMMNISVFAAGSDCSGVPQSTGPFYEQVNITVTEYNITCCSGKQCEYGAAEVYQSQTGDCSDIDNTTIPIKFNQITNVCQITETDNYYTQCGNGTLNYYYFDNSDCSGVPQFGLQFIDGVCGPLGLPVNTGCQTAIDTCATDQPTTSIPSYSTSYSYYYYSSSSTTPAPITTTPIASQYSDIPSYAPTMDPTDIPTLEPTQPTSSPTPSPVLMWYVITFYNVCSLSVKS